MTNIYAQETQRKLAEKLNAITVRRIAIESFEEQIEEYIDDLVHLYKEAGTKKTKGDVKLLVDVYVDAEKAKSEEETKIDRATLKLNQIEAVKEDLSVLDQYRNSNIYDSSEVFVDKWIKDSDEKGT